MEELMPIFNQIRARGEIGNAYPLHVSSTAGPTLHMTQVNPNSCHWVRERSQRSVPMGSLPRTSKSSLSAGTPDSLSDTESSSFRTPKRPVYRSNLTPGGSRNNSRPASRTGSRPGSKPPSRHGSNLSLDSTDDGTPSRIPRRSIGGRPSNISTTTKKTLNGSRPRTPTGLISPASPSGRTRTPSGSNTPVHPDQPTAVSRLLRKSSGASDTTTGQVKKKTSLADREPFRL